MLAVQVWYRAILVLVVSFLFSHTREKIINEIFRFEDVPSCCAGEVPEYVLHELSLWYLVYFVDRQGRQQHRCYGKNTFDLTSCLQSLLLLEKTQSNNVMKIWIWWYMDTGFLSLHIFYSTINSKLCLKYQSSFTIYIEEVQVDRNICLGRIICKCFLLHC